MNVILLVMGMFLEGVAIILIEHDMKVVMGISDRVVVLDHGLDFSLSPHDLLREAARSVRPGGSGHSDRLCRYATTSTTSPRTTRR